MNISYKNKNHITIEINLTPYSRVGQKRSERKPDTPPACVAHKQSKGRGQSSCRWLLWMLVRTRIARSVDPTAAFDRNWELFTRWLHTFVYWYHSVTLFFLSWGGIFFFGCLFYYWMRTKLLCPDIAAILGHISVYYWFMNINYSTSLHIHRQVKMMEPFFGRNRLVPFSETHAGRWILSRDPMMTFSVLRW